MINLLPPDIKENTLYARRNTKLLHWSLVMLLTIVGVVFVVVAGQLYINRSIKSYAAQVDQAREQLRVQKLEETQARVQDISSSLKLVVQVLSRQVLFSALLKQIGSAMPSGSVLTGLSINKVQGGIDLTAAATNYQTATQVQVNLQDPTNKIFEKADIVSVQCSANADAATELEARYPCKITIRALFTSDNPFLFIKASGAQP